MSDHLFEMDSLPSRTASPAVPKRRPFFMSKEEEYRQIRQCRYIRKTRRQQTDVEKFDFTSLFKNLPVMKTEIIESVKQIDEGDHMNNNINENDGSDKKIIEESEVDKMKVKEKTTCSTGESETKEVLPVSKEKVWNRQMNSPIKPVIIHESQFLPLKKRDKLEPLLMRTENWTKLPSEANKKIEYLYKEVSLAAKNANINIANEKRNMQRHKEAINALEAIWKANKSKKRWAIVRHAVKSGWLCSRKGRAVKLAKDRRKKRLLNQINQLTPATLSRRAVMKVNDQLIETSFVKRKLERQQSLPPLLTTTSVNGKSRSPSPNKKILTLSCSEKKRGSIA